MKHQLLSVLVILFCLPVFSQTVENIQVEQDGENLKINYRIGGSNSDQLYFVTLTCSIDGGKVFEPKSVLGDVGANISGGKPVNTIIWDVFKDVDEIGSVEFFVKVDLMNKRGADMADGVKNDPGKRSFEHTISLGYSGAFSAEVQHLVGINISTLGNWGGYVSFRTGGYDEAWGGYLLSLTAGATKYITSQDKLRLHAYSGIGVGDYADEFEFEAGMIGVIGGRINLSLGIAITQYFVEPVFGLGYVF